MIKQSDIRAIINRYLSDIADLKADIAGIEVKIAEKEALIARWENELEDEAPPKPKSVEQLFPSNVMLIRPSINRRGF